VFFPAHVAFMSRGVAGRFRKCPENNENNMCDMKKGLAETKPLIELVSRT
jgi:hypothetical protein